MKLSLAITTFNRFDFTVESFYQVIDNPNISDIVIMDDASTDGSYERLAEKFKDHSKVRVVRQAQNRNMSRNKADAIGLAHEPWVIIFDSDNIIDNAYVDAAANMLDAFREESNILMPSFAKPGFDYRKYAGVEIYKDNVKQIIVEPMGNCLFNTANYVVNKDFYAETYLYNPVHIASDTIWYNYLHLKKGGTFYVMHEMQYFHRQHAGSGFLQNVEYNMEQSEAVRQLILQL